MPKNKTHSGIKKRVKVTGTGKLLRRAGRQAPPARAQASAAAPGASPAPTRGSPRPTRQRVKRLLGR